MTKRKAGLSRMPPLGEPQLLPEVRAAYIPLRRPLSLALDGAEVWDDWTQDADYQCMVEAYIALHWFPEAQ